MRLADLDLAWLKEVVRNTLPTHPDWKAHFGPTRVLDHPSLVLDIVYSYDVVPRNMAKKQLSRRRTRDITESAQPADERRGRRRQQLLSGGNGRT